MKKPSERILELLNAHKTLDDKEKESEITMYETIAIARYLDEEWVKVRKSNGEAYEDKK